MNFERCRQEDDQSEIGIILSVPTAPTSVSESVGFGADESSYTQTALSCGIYEGVGSSINSVLSTSSKPMVVTFEKYGRQKLYPIAMVSERSNREVWLYYAPGFKDHLVVVTNYISESCWGGEISGLVRKIRNLKGRGIPECFGTMTSLREDCVSRSGPASKENTASFNTRSHSDGKFSSSRLSKEFLAHQRTDGSLNVVNTAYIEFFPGVLLSDVIERSSFHLPAILAKRWGPYGRRPLSDRVIAHLLKGVLNGLSALHESGTAHGNLRPDVVLISPDLRVSLYGVGFFSGSVDVERLRWRAPDLSLLNTWKECTGPQSLAGDIWAFGCLAFYLTTYKIPFQGKDDMTSVMSYLNLLRFAAPKEVSVFLNSGSVSSENKWASIFGDLHEVKNKDLRDLISQCIELNWKRRPTVSAIRNHRLFTERCYVIKHFRQREVRCFMERTGLDAFVNLNNLDEMTSLESLVTLNPVKYQDPPDAIPSVYPIEEINELLLSFIIKDLFLWLFIFGIRRKRKITEARLRLCGSSGRSSVPLIRQQLLKSDILSDVDFAALKLTRGLARMVAFVITEAALVGVDYRKFVPECVKSADADEDLHRISVILSRFFSAEDADPECCVAKPPLPPLCIGALPDTKGITTPPLQLQDEPDQDHISVFSAPTSHLPSEVHDADIKNIHSSGRSTADDVEIKSLVTTLGEDQTLDDTVISFSLGSDDGNENVIERGLLHEERNTFRASHFITPLVGPVGGMVPVNGPPFFDDAKKCLVIIFSIFVFVVVVIVSVPITTVLALS